MRTLTGLSLRSVVQALECTILLWRLHSLLCCKSGWPFKEVLRDKSRIAEIPNKNRSFRLCLAAGESGRQWNQDGDPRLNAQTFSALHANCRFVLWMLARPSEWALVLKSTPARNRRKAHFHPCLQPPAPLMLPARK